MINDPLATVETLDLALYQPMSAETDKQTMIRDMRLLYYSRQLLTEAAEFSGKVSKMYRDKVNNRDEAIKELGDVLWYITQIATFCDVEIAKEKINDPGSYAHDLIDDDAMLIYQCLDVYSAVYLQSKPNGGGDGMAAARLATWKDIHGVVRQIQICAVHLGSTIEEIAAANYEKLSSRLDRGVISGSGDNR